MQNRDEILLKVESWENGELEWSEEKIYRF